MTDKEFFTLATRHFTIEGRSRAGHETFFRIRELVILTHFSRRYSRQEIRDAVRRRLPHALRERVRLALPEPWQRA